MVVYINYLIHHVDQGSWSELPNKSLLALGTKLILYLHHIVNVQIHAKNYKNKQEPAHVSSRYTHVSDF